MLGWMLMVRAFSLMIAVMLIFPSTDLRAGEAVSDVQRLQQQRDQQQLELLLKMQQQRDRAIRPAPNATADFKTRQLERDQQQRQQQLLEQQSRSSAMPGTGVDVQTETVRREVEQARAAQAAIEQAQRFEAERRMQAEQARDERIAP